MDYKTAHCESADVLLVHCPHCNGIDTVFKAGISKTLLLCGRGCQKVTSVILKEGTAVVSCTHCGEIYKIPNSIVG